jgi:RimJ/RimL family protein N-acetyltransferase
MLIPDHGIGPDVEIGWRLVRKAWGRGIATEAARRLLTHAFAMVELPRVVADIASANRASQRVAEKIGMERVESMGNRGGRYDRFQIRSADRWV